MNGSEINETGYWALDIDGITAKPIMPKPLKPEPSPSKLLSGFISRDEVYTLPELQRRLVIRPAAWRVMRRKGLPFYASRQTHIGLRAGLLRVRPNAGPT
jgi:hypothetical protein